MIRILVFAVMLGLAAAMPARAEMDEAARAARWADLRHAIFGERPVSDGAALVSIDAPARAENAALVPVTLRVDSSRSKDVRKLYLVIDDNPSPLAAVFSFGPAADPREIATRVRVDDYTNLHAVAEMADGTLFVAEHFIKAAGGCSAADQPSQQLRAADGPAHAQLHPGRFHPAGADQLCGEGGADRRFRHCAKRRSELPLRLAARGDGGDQGRGR
jgi:sulfur-oxidizing protein SoxY